MNFLRIRRPVETLASVAFRVFMTVLILSGLRQECAADNRMPAGMLTRDEICRPNPNYDLTAVPVLASNTITMNNLGQVLALEQPSAAQVMNSGPVSYLENTEYQPSDGSTLYFKDHYDLDILQIVPIEPHMYTGVIGPNPGWDLNVSYENGVFTVHGNGEHPPFQFPVMFDAVSAAFELVSAADIRYGVVFPTRRADWNEPTAEPSPIVLGEGQTLIVKSNFDTYYKVGNLSASQSPGTVSFDLACLANCQYRTRLWLPGADSRYGLQAGGHFIGLAPGSLSNNWALINDYGKVITNTGLPNRAYPGAYYVYEQGMLVDLPASSADRFLIPPSPPAGLSGKIQALNNSDTEVRGSGYAWVGNVRHASLSLYDNQTRTVTMSFLPPHPLDSSIYAYDAHGLNNSSQVVGRIKSPGGGSDDQAYVYLPQAAYGYPAGMNILTIGSQTTSITPLKIDDSGKITGHFKSVDDGETRGFILDLAPGSLKVLEPVSSDYSDAFVNGANKDGQAAGYSFSIGLGSRATLWDKDGNPQDLNSRIPDYPGWELGAVYAINDTGQILGTGKLNGAAAVFLLTPGRPICTPNIAPISHGLLPGRLVPGHFPQELVFP
jgi:hypothetical protein